MTTHQHVYYVPHPDDETLSMGLHIASMIAAGNNVHVVFMSRGGTTGAKFVLNGVTALGAVQTCGFHGWVHNPVREGYEGAVLDKTEIALARLHEGVSAIGLLASMPAMGGVTPGNLTWSESGLSDSFGGGTLPPAPAGVDAVEAVMKEMIDLYPNAFHLTMSESDQQPDHAACGAALRRLKSSTDLVPGRTITYQALLGASKFFVSRLYWANSAGIYPPEVMAAANGTLSWYAAAQVGPRYTEMAAVAKRAQQAYSAWNPAEGAFAIGYHSVRSQFADNFGSGVAVANIIHL